MSHFDGYHEQVTFQGPEVRHLGTQSTVQRFGPNCEPFLPSWDRIDGDGEVDRAEEIRRERAYIMPRVEEYRNNLTVLSQRYNLYFAGYGHQIYVYRPSGPGQVLSKEPIMILTSPPNARGKAYRGPRRHRGAHSLNHIVVGCLGDEEVIICACHDGDVYAYYTNAIEGSLHLSGEPPIPFFYENVGISAWGLTVHAKSRLIAVSSNNHEVTVFAFGLNPSSEMVYEPESPDNPGPTPNACYSRESVFDTDVERQNLLSGLSSTGSFSGIELETKPSLSFNTNSAGGLSRRNIPRDENGRVMRGQNFKFVISVRPDGDNLPSIAFSEDEDGAAMSIIAADVKGNLWFLKLWEEDIFYRKSPEEGKRGWGVLALPSKMFAPTTRYLETFGHAEFVVRLESNPRESVFDITEGMRHVADGHLACSFMEAKVLISSHLLSTPGSGSGIASNTRDMDLLGEEEKSFRDIIKKMNTFNQMAALAEFRSRIQEFVGSSMVLFTDRHDARFIMATGPPSTICRNIVRYDAIRGSLAFPDHDLDHNRLNILAAIPSLSLVVAASQVGRVALLTITRRVLESKEVTNTITFRVERTLPLFQRDGNGVPFIDGGGLLGMALGPMQGSLRGGKRPGPKKYRLMLHYIDHSVISYQIFRDFETQKVHVDAI